MHIGYWSSQLLLISVGIGPETNILVDHLVFGARSNETCIQHVFPELDSSLLWIIIHRAHRVTNGPFNPYESILWWTKFLVKLFFLFG